MSEVTREQEIAQIEMPAPHVVLLGAGASRAAFPNGDTNGRRLPLMADFSEIVPIGEVLDPAGIPHRGRNLEQLYSKLSRDKKLRNVCARLEQMIYGYFDSLALPNEPTLYDYLILSLRPKDVIATFNWDPFLIQAARRTPKRSGLPQLLFLHGNVAAGYCTKDCIRGVKNTKCPECGKRFSPSQILYPTAEKDYDQNPMIRDAWRSVADAFKHAFMVTVFGYSAPKTDVAAIAALKLAWGSPEKRVLEQFEIIDVREQKELRKAWSAFIHTHHFETHANAYDSWFFNHPRRTGEAYINQIVNAHFIENNPIPRELDRRGLAKWFKPLLRAESRAKSNGND